MLDRGADIEASSPPYEETPLFIAARSSSPEALSYLVEKGADLHARVRQEISGIPTGGTVLHGAAGGWGPEGEIERCVKILLAQGMEINTAAETGATALDVAFNSRWVTEEHQRQRLIEFMRHLGGLRAEELK